MIEEKFSSAARDTEVLGIRLHWYSEGTGRPVLFLHGIPTHSYLWRNVLPRVGQVCQAIALDLAGYGGSEVPKDGDASIARQAALLRGFVESLGLRDLILVVNDLGSLVGLKFAVENPGLIRGLVLLEAAFMPARDWYRQLTPPQKMMFSLMRIPGLARHWIVTKNRLPRMMMAMAVIRKLRPAELDAYIAPYAEDERRRLVVLEGPGPATFPPGGKSLRPGDFADELDRVAAQLVPLSAKVPMLIIHGSPGMITRKPALRYAARRFARVEFCSVGRGRHFLQEDHPDAVAEAILSWMPRC